MKPLPEWTNNRLIVGLILAWISIAVAAIQGLLVWYVLLVLGPAFGLTIVFLIQPYRSTRLLQDLVVRLWSLRKPLTAGVRYSFITILILLAVLVVIFTLSYTLLLAVHAARKTTWSLSIEESPSSPYVLLAPILFYIVLSLSRAAAGIRFVVVGVGQELATVSLMVSFMGVLFDLRAASSQKIEVTSKLVVFLLNLVVLLAVTLLTRRIQKDRARRPPGHLFSIRNLAFMFMEVSTWTLGLSVYITTMYCVMRNH